MAFVKANNTKNKTIYKGVTLGIAIALIIGFFAFKTIQKKQLIEDTESIAADGSNIIQENIIFMPKENMVAGTFLDSEDFIITTTNQTVPSNTVKDVEELENMRLSKDIVTDEILEKDFLIHKNAWFGDVDRGIEVAFPEGAIPSTISADKLPGKFVDIGILRQGGEDEIVVSKAAIAGNTGNRLFFHLDEEERENLREAVGEGMLFLNIYLSENQTASEVTYIPQYKKELINTIEEQEE